MLKTRARSDQGEKRNKEMDKTKQKQTLSSSSLRMMNTNGAVQHQQSSKIPTTNGVRMLSSASIQNFSKTTLSSSSVARTNGTSIVLKSKAGEVMTTINNQTQKEASIFSSRSGNGIGSNGSTRKLLLSSTSLRGNPSEGGNLLVSSSSNISERSTNNLGNKTASSSNVANAQSIDAGYRSSPNLSSTTLTSSSSGLRLTTTTSNGNTTVSLANGKNHNNTSAFPSCGGSTGSDGETAKCSSPSNSSCRGNGSLISSTSDKVLEENPGNRLSCASAISLNSSYISQVTSEFSDCGNDTTAFSSFDCPDQDLNNTAVESLSDDANNSIDIFAKTPAAKIVRKMITGEDGESLLSIELANSDEEVDEAEILVPATQQVVLSPDGSGPLQLNPNDIIIVVASDDDEEDADASYIGSYLNPAETAMCIESDALDVDASLEIEEDDDASTVIVPATQQLPPEIFEMEALGPSVVPCSDEEEETSPSQSQAPKQNENKATSQSLNSTFTVSPFPMKISSRADGKQKITVKNPEINKNGSTLNIPKLQLESIEEMDIDIDERLNHLDQNVSSSDDTSQNQPMNSTFVLNLPHSQKSREELNVTFTASPSSVPSFQNQHKKQVNEDADADKQVKGCADRVEIKREDVIVGANSDQDSTKAKLEVVRCQIDNSFTVSVPAKLEPSSESGSTSTNSIVKESQSQSQPEALLLGASSIIASLPEAAPSPRRGKKFYDIPVPPPLKTIEPRKSVDSSDSEEEYTPVKNPDGSDGNANSNSPLASLPRCAKPKTYSKRGRDSKADREALFETENPRPSTSAALVRHNQRSLKLKSKAKGSNTNNQSTSTVQLKNKSSRVLALARGRSKKEEFVLKPKPKSKPKLNIISKKVRMVQLSSSEDENETEQDLPLSNFSKDKVEGKLSENETEEIDAKKIEVESHSQNKGDLKSQDGIELRKEPVDGDGIKTDDNNQSPESLPPTIAIANEVVAHTPNASQEVLQESPRKRGRPVRKQNQVEVSPVTHEPCPVPPINSSKPREPESKSCKIENRKQKECELRSNSIENQMRAFPSEGRNGERNGNIRASTAPPDFCSADKTKSTSRCRPRSRASSVVEDQRRLPLSSPIPLVFISSESESEKQQNKKCTRSKSRSSSRNGTNEAKAKSKTRSNSKTREPENSVDTATLTERRPSRTRSRSTPSLSEVSETETDSNPSRLAQQRKVIISNGHRGKRKGSRMEVLKEEDEEVYRQLPLSPSRCKRIRKESAVDNQNTNETPDSEVQPTRRGRPPKKRKPEAESETQDSNTLKTTSKKAKNVEDKKEKLKGRGRITPELEPEPADEPLGLRRSRRTRRERDLGDGMVPFFK